MISIIRQKYEPLVLADTTRLTFAERLEYQKLGIMADELPTIYQNNQMEKTEYNSVLGLFLEKMSRRSKAELDEAVQTRLKRNEKRVPIEPELPIFGVNRRPLIDVGEDFELSVAHSYTLKWVIAKYLSTRLGAPVYSPSLLLQHPHHPYMLARPDFVAVFPDSDTGELNRMVNVKCKTATHWKLEDLKEELPLEHELHCRQEMAVANLDETIIVYLCDNNEGGIALYHLDRDQAAEAKIIQCVKAFWQGNVEKEIVPLPTVPSNAADRDIALYAMSRKKYHRPPDVLERGMPELLAAYAKKKEAYDKCNDTLESLKEEVKGIELKLSTLMLEKPEGSCGDIKMRWITRKSRTVDMDGLAAAYPDIYARFVTENSKPAFEVRMKKPAPGAEKKTAA